MKKLSIFLTVALFATIGFTSCKDKCDKNDPESECYDSQGGTTDPKLTTDAGVMINGVKWATRNVDKPGTFAATSTSAGMFYQWNSKVGWSSTDPMKNSNGETNWNTKYNSGAKWVSDNDPCPAGWRVPTLDELKELINAGYNLSSTGCTFGSGNNSVFLLSAGCRLDGNGTLEGVGSYGLYWSSTMNSSSGGGGLAYHLQFGNVTAFTDSFFRSSGYSVRCVAAE